MTGFEELIKMNDDFYQLLNKLAEIRNTFTISPTDYNIFSVLNLQNDETRLHSRMIADLLNPNGKHKKGILLLKKFYDVMKAYGVKIDPIFDDVQIKIEYPLGDKDCKSDRPTGGRIDILLINENHVIGIENKIGASDEDFQLTRYYNSLHDEFGDKKTVYLLYLNPNGKEPSMNSIYKNKQKRECNKEYFIISYRIQILNWLENIKSEICNSNDRFYDILVQYIDIINSMIRRFEMLDKIQSTLVDEVEKQIYVDRFKSLTFIADNIESIEKKFILSVIEKIEYKLKENIDSFALERKEKQKDFLIFEYKINNGNTLIFKYRYKNHDLHYGINGDTNIDKNKFIEGGKNSAFTQKKRSSLLDNEKDTSVEINKIVEECKQIINQVKGI